MPTRYTIALVGAALSIAHVSASTLARWDFEGGDLSAGEQGNFIATSVEALDGGSLVMVQGSGIGGGGALAYEYIPLSTPNPVEDGIVLFTITNTHPSENILLELSTVVIGGGSPGQSYAAYMRTDAHPAPFDVDDAVSYAGEWTTWTVPLLGLGQIPAELAPGESLGVGWGVRRAGAGTYLFDNITITGTEPIPEPGTGLMLVLAAAGASGLRRR